MTTIRYFSGETELNPNSVHVQGRKLLGEPVGYVSVYDRAAQRWVHGYIPVERRIEYKSNPSKHVCDAHCMNATGRTMQCECSCGGKNHGRGAFNCAAVA